MTERRRRVNSAARWRGLIVVLGMMQATSTRGDEHLADVVATIRPAVVGVGTYAAVRRPPALLAGTGFVIGNGNLAVTNRHVVDRPLDAEHREYIAVFIGHGQDGQYRKAEIVRTDEDHDLVLLQFEGPPVPTIALAPDEPPPVREGASVAFTGYPIGTVLGLYPVTHQGIVSALTPIAVPAPNARNLSAAKIAALRDPYAVIQLDATAYPGNSGSPVFRQDNGQVVGIINQVLVKGKKEDMLRDPSAISYAIPVRFLRALIERKDARP